MGTEQQTSGQSCPLPGEGADKKEEEGLLNTDPRVYTALTAFLNSLTARNVRQHSRIAYQTDLTQLFTWLLENDVTVSAPRHVSRGHILEYLAFLAHQGRSGVSRARKLAAIRDYFKDLNAEELLLASPARTLALPKKERKSRVYLREDESMKCLNAAAGHNRDDAILPLFLQTGIRLAELAGLILSDLHEQVPVPSDGILRKCSWSLRLFLALPQHLNTLFPTILSFAPCNMTSY